MRLKVLLPSRVFLQAEGLTRIVAQGRTGLFGLLEHRRDCVAALAPGILTYQVQGSAERYLAVDEGVLVKAGAEVTVATRSAVEGVELGALREAIESEFSHRDQAEQTMRTVLAKLESSFVRRFLDLHQR